MFGSQKQETTTKVDPYLPAKAPLDQHLGLIENAAPWTAYGGPGVAPLANMEQMALNSIPGQFNLGNALATGNQVGGYNLANQGFGGAANMYGGVYNSPAAFNAGLDMNLVNQYANNPYLNQQIDAASRDVARNLYENQMPGIAAYSAGSGNLGSSRRGMQEGIAERAAADRIADTAAQMRGSAYNQGLSVAAQQAAQNAALQQAHYQNQLTAAGGFGNLGAQGLQQQALGQDQYGSNLNYALGGGALQRGITQDQLDYRRNLHYERQEMPYRQAGAGTAIAMEPAEAFGLKTSETEGGGGSPFSQIAPILGTVGGAIIGGPVGAAIGGGIGSLFGGAGQQQPVGNLYDDGSSYQNPFNNDPMQYYISGAG